MVAGRVGEDAPSALLRGQPRQRVVGAAELEGADALEVLALEEDASPRPLVHGIGREDGRPVGHSTQTDRGRGDIFVGHERLGGERRGSGAVRQDGPPREAWPRPGGAALARDVAKSFVIRSI